MRILLVEDEEGIAEAVRRSLEKARYHVDVATSGEECLALAHEGGHALVVLDVMLPDIDGCTVCGRLRRARNAVPILMPIRVRRDSPRATRCPIACAAWKRAPTTTW